MTSSASSTVSHGPTPCTVNSSHHSWLSDLLPFQPPSLFRPRSITLFASFPTASNSSSDPFSASQDQKPDATLKTLPSSSTSAYVSSSALQRSLVVTLLHLATAVLLPPTSLASTAYPDASFLSRYRKRIVLALLSAWQSGSRLHPAELDFVALARSVAVVDGSEGVLRVMVEVLKRRSEQSKAAGEARQAMDFEEPEVDPEAIWSELDEGIGGFFADLASRASVCPTEQHRMVIAVGFGNVAALVGLSQSVVSADIQVCSLAHILSLSIPLV